MRSSRSCLYLSYSRLSCSRESWMAWSPCSHLPCNYYCLLGWNSVIIMGLGFPILEPFWTSTTCITPCIWCSGYRNNFHAWSCSPWERERTCRLAYHPTSLATCEIGRRCEFFLVKLDGQAHFSIKGLLLVSGKSTKRLSNFSKKLGTNLRGLKLNWQPRKKKTRSSKRDSIISPPNKVSSTVMFIDMQQ